MNADIIAELRGLADLAGKSSHKHIAYNAAAKSIQGVTFSLHACVAKRECPKIPYVGKKIWAIIAEFYALQDSGQPTTIRKELEAINEARSVFTKIHGVAEVTADTWIKRGILTLDQLKAAVAAGDVKLNQVQTHGLIYYADLNTRIPRAEVEKITEQVRGIIARTGITVVNPPICAGSWRRGAADSGDVDVLLSVRDTNHTGPAVKLIAKSLGSDCVILSEGDTKVTFLMRGWTFMRQVDVLVVPAAEFGASLLYFTGSWEFNEAMRRFAKDKGWRLNQTGLYDERRKLVASETEESIFAALGLKYVDPPGRIGAASIVPLIR